MKHFKHSLALLPLLSILSMSPADINVKYGRSIASEEIQIEVDKPLEIKREEILIQVPKIEVSEIKVDLPKIEVEKHEPIVIKHEEILTPLPKIEVSEIKVDLPKINHEVKHIEKAEKHPKLKEISSRVDSKLIVKDANLDTEKLIAKRDELKKNLLKLKEEFKKDQSDKKLVAEQRIEIEKLVIDLLLVEGGLKDLQEGKKIDQAEDDKTSALISESKDIAEVLIADLLANEELVAKKSEEKPAVVVKKEENKKEEIKREKKEIASKKEENCEHEKNVVTTPQLDALVAQQNQIMQQMMNMSQIMMMQSMMIQQQMMMSQFNSAGTQNSPYQYASPFTSGNWVYHPQGFQPQQQNIFAPQMGSQMGGMNGGMYPDQVHSQQQQGGWGLQPQMSFGGPQAPVMNGTFGFNMGGQSNFANPMVQQQQPQQVAPVQTLPFIQGAPAQQQMQMPLQRT